MRDSTEQVQEEYTNYDTASFSLLDLLTTN